VTDNALGCRRGSKLDRNLVDRESPAAEMSSRGFEVRVEARTALDRACERLLTMQSTEG
jgi:hypothetical protein